MTVSKHKTTDKIKQSLTELLALHAVEDISATDLCKHAGMTRATFYYHYDSVQDVLNEIEAQTEIEFMQWMKQSSFDSNNMPAKMFYINFFEFVVRNVAVCRMLLNAQRPSEFMMRALEAGRTKAISIMSRLYPHCPAVKIDYYYIYVSSGFLGLLRYWLNSGMKESPAEIAEIGEKISNMGIAYLEK